MLDAFASESTPPGAYSEDSGVFEGVAELWELWIVSVVESYAVDGVSHFFEALGDEDGESSASGDKPNGGWWWWGIGQDGEDAGHELV